MTAVKERLLLFERLDELCRDTTAACLAEKHEAAELYQQLWPGASIREVAKASGLSRTTIAEKRNHNQKDVQNRTDQNESTKSPLNQEKSSDEP